MIRDSVNNCNKCDFRHVSGLAEPCVSCYQAYNEQGYYPAFKSTNYLEKRDIGYSAPSTYPQNSPD